MSFALNIIIKSTLIMMGAAALAMLLRRSSASVRHAVWILAMGSILLLPSVALLVPQFEWSVLPGASASVTFLETGLVDAVGESAAAGGGHSSSASHPQQPFLLRPAVVWMLGVSLMLLRFAAGALAVNRLARRATPPAGDNWQKMTLALSRTIGIRKRVRLLVSERRVSPMTWGLWRHTILLPSAAADWSDERRRLVLAHELAHVKRRDGLLQVLVQVVCSIYWFNPLVWFAAHRIRMERERACDDRVLSLGTTAAEYADHLVQIVRGLRGQRAFSFAAISMAQPSQLETRLVSILDAGVRRGALSKAGSLLLFVMAGLVTLSVAAIGVTAAVHLPPVFVAPAKAAAPVVAATTASKPATVPQRTHIGEASTAPNNAVVPPQVRESSPPTYTPEAVNANIEGTVTLEGMVDSEGKVSGLRVIKGLGFGLDKKAIDAVLGWKFTPALRNDEPVDAVTQIEVDFRIPPWYMENPQDDVPPVKIEGGVKPPTVTFRVEPEYTPEAREAKYSGTVVVAATVHQNGRLTVDKVLQELDYGLTVKAIEALEQWKFKPGVMNGRNVPVSLKIEVNFRLK